MGKTRFLFGVTWVASRFRPLHVLKRALAILIRMNCVRRTMKEKICAHCNEVIPPAQITGNRQKTHKGCRREYNIRSACRRAESTSTRRCWQSIKKRMKVAGYDATISPVDSEDMKSLAVQVRNGAIVMPYEPTPSKDIQALILKGMQHDKRVRKRQEKLKAEQEEEERKEEERRELDASAKKVSMDIEHDRELKAAIHREQIKMLREMDEQGIPRPEGYENYPT